MSAGPASLQALGWDDARAAELEALPGCTAARVVAVDRGRAGLAGPEGTPEHALVRSIPVACGDWVALDADGAIEAVLERRGALARADEKRSGSEVLVANVDVVLVCGGLDGDFNVRRLERFVALGAAAGVEVAVVLTKADAVEDPALKALDVKDALGGTVSVLALSALDGEGLERLTPWLRPAATTALLGSSGVGKSTLVNALLGDERQATQPVREGDDRGRHTTVRRELLVLPSGALLVDTPGLRAPGVHDGAGVERAFSDVEALAEQCRFADCTHGEAVSSDTCAVRAALADGTLAAERWAGYEELAKEAAFLAAREDARAKRERDARTKAIHREQRALYRDRGRR